MAEPVLERFLALPAVEQRCLELFAVVHEPINRTAMAQWLKNHGVRALGSRAISTTDLSTMITGWEAAGLVIDVSHPPDGRGPYRVTTTLSHPLFAYLLRRGELQPLAAAVRALSPLKERYSYHIVPSRMARELLLSMYLGSTDECTLAFNNWKHVSTQRDSTPELLLLDAYGLAAPKDGLRRIGVPLGELYAHAACELAINHLAVLGPDVLAWISETRQVLSPGVLGRAAFYLSLRGEQGTAHDLLGGLADAQASAARSFILLTEGKLTEARAEAMSALQLSRPKAKKNAKSATKVKLLDILFAPWVILMLATAGEGDAMEQARTQLVLLASKHADRPLLTLALEALSLFLTQPDTNLQPLPGQLQRTAYWDERLIAALVCRFVEQPLPPQFWQKLSGRASLCEQHGFRWLSEELGRACTNDLKHGLTLLYQREQPWERLVRGLDAAIAQAEKLTDAPETGPDERLVWTLVLDAAGHQLAARVQSRTRNGWTSGRQVAWKKLAESPADVPWLTAADRRVLSHVKIRDGQQYWGAPPTYVLSPEAPMALVGHPLVFADYALREAVEIVKGPTRLDVRTDGDQIVLSVEPSACLEHGVVCERDGAGRIVVYGLTPAQRVIASQLSQRGLRLPAAAREPLQRTLARLVTHFPVASEVDVEGAHIEEIEADPRIHAQLRRWGSGLAVRLCVAPLGKAPLFVPGEGSPSVLGQHGTGDTTRTARATRDLPREREALQRLRDACPTLAAYESDERELCIDDLVSCLEFLCELQKLGDEVVVEWPSGQPLSLAAERDVRHVRLTMSSQADWLAADGELEVDLELKLSLRELLARSAASKGRFIALDDGRFVALTESLKKTLDTMGALSHMKGDHIALHPLALGSLAGLGDTFAHFKRDKGVAARLARVREAAELEPTLPVGFEAELRPYQRTGFEWLTRLTHWGAGACLADDMGLGKTLQALALLVARAPQGPSIVVAPTSVCSNWIDEARRFAPTLTVTRLGQGDREKALGKLAPFDLLVCSYGLLQQEIERLEKQRFAVIVVDEAQAIKNASTQRTRAAMRLVGDARLALTGTPVENHLGELWSIMTFLNPGVLGTAKAFEERFVKPIQRDSDPQAAKLLKRLVRPFILRRKKNEVLDDLPEKTVITLRVEASEQEQALFEALREQALERMSGKDEGQTGRIRILAELMRLRRAACHPDLVAPEAKLTSSKLATFEAVLDELREGGHRALVFSQFVDYLSIVRARLEELGIRYQYLDGSSSTTQRAKAVRDFQAGEGDVFLISLKAGGFGLNLTDADYVVHLDPWWNPAVEDQASDRAHRIGQTRPVTIYRLVMAGSIEEKILSLHATKRDIADQLLDGTGGAGALGVDELMALLREGEALPVEAGAKRGRGARASPS